jgi:hypothetical protein
MISLKLVAWKHDRSSGLELSNIIRSVTVIEDLKSSSPWFLSLLLLDQPLGIMPKQKTIVIGAGPVGALAALYAAQRGHDVEIYELRSGTFDDFLCIFSIMG